jgi:hypothetical protein
MSIEVIDRSFYGVAIGALRYAVTHPMPRSAIEYNCDKLPNLTPRRVNFCVLRRGVLLL